MKNIIRILLIAFLIQSCQEKQEISSIDPINWSKRKVIHPLNDSIIKGTTYLSIYPQIYSQTEHKTHNLTATVSMRNTNRNDSIFIEKAEFFDTKGKLIRTYFEQTIYIAPMETVEIVIDEIDSDGGTGSNFLFDWKIRPNSNEPFFEGIMISTYGQQGLSFTTSGKRIY